jgi:hypothetical protein
MDPLTIVIILALAATSVTLLLGLISMGGSPTTNRFASTPLMWVRVGFQAFTLLLLLVAVLLQN